MDPGMDIYTLAGKPRAELESGGGKVAWVEDGLNTVELSTSAAADTTLILRDQRYPGWHATVDGVPVAIDGEPERPAVRKVRMPAGNHTVRFSFSPASVQCGIFFALSALALCAGLFAAASNRAVIRR